MERLKQVLQLQADGVPIREIARRVGISRNSVRKYLSRLSSTESNSAIDLADNAYISDLPELDAERLRQVTVHFSNAGAELSRTGVTRQLLWQEYMAQNPDGYSYSRYCYHLQQYLKNRDLSMHLEYQPGDMTMIDFAGKKLHYIDLGTGEQVACEVFIATLPFSGFIFCHPLHTQRTVDFAHAINCMARFYGGLTATIICDNMRTAVKRADRYELQFTDVCLQLSDHYTTSFSATRPYHPRDKAMVERAVNIVYNHIYGPLRHRQFTSLASLQTAMHEHD
ncbi:IS21 family transposase [Pseudoflavitalea rhizosphaerae]|uniref:IS21 family transposase n=1 Tax=Pseudoflavitalea rhizosphaerae TaxID=1884793 RepID=UPI0013DFC9FF|nr:IS21 family transposase [Pseudoflavitalea rhizosphaerae]